MWKLNRFLVIFLALFLSLFASMSPLTILKANAIESYKISPEDERNFKRGVYSRTSIPDENRIDMHYYFYSSNNYDENIKLIIYSCDYLDYSQDPYRVAKKDGCGLYMVNEGGYFKIKLTSSVYGQAEYSRRTGKIVNYYGMNYNSYDKNEIARFTDQDFENGLTLLGGTALKENSWNRAEGGFLLDPIGGNSGGSSNNNSGGFNIDFGGFVKGIVDGIANFFRPMMDSVSRTAQFLSTLVGDISNALGDFFRPMIDSLASAVDWLSKLGSTIVNGITDFFRNLVDTVVNIWDFLSNFFVKLIEELGKFVKWIFVPSQESLNSVLSGFKSEFDNSIEPFKRFINIEILSDTNSSLCSFNLSDARFKVDVCGVPDKLLNWARIFINFALGLWTISRILGFIPILLGSFYVWERWFNFEQGRN